MYTIMSEAVVGHDSPHWYAIKTRQEFRAAHELARVCDDVLFLTEQVKDENRHVRTRAIIPRVLFIRTTGAKALEMEADGREHPEMSVPFWIYRYPKENRIQEIPGSSIELLRLLTARDTTKCEIFTKTDFKENQRVRVTGGQFAGYEGYVVRVQKNKHVVVKIEGICMVLLPFIHPDLLAPVSPIAL